LRDAFTVLRSRCSDLTDPGLRQEILLHTGSDDEVTSILRCLERFGFDASVRHFEMIPKPSHRSHRGANPVSWSVTAVRS
jgi:hypothetical protein